MSQRPLLLAVSGVLVVSLGACVLNTVGLSSTSSEGAGGGATSVTSGVPATGAGGATGVTTAAQSSATAQSSASAGGAGTSSASSSASSSSASSSSASSSSASSSSASSSSASSSSGGGGVTCDSQYNSAPGYQLCDFKGTLCEFNVNLLNMTTCGAVCAALGGECKAKLDNSTACVYENGNKGCGAMFINAVCRCSLGCGGGPPCVGNQVCINDACKDP